MFQNPTIGGGYHIDRCANFAANCDQEAADTYCRMSGFERASSFRWSYKSPTLTLQDRRVCNVPSCGGFDYVACVGG